MVSLVRVEADLCQATFRSGEYGHRSQVLPQIEHREATIKTSNGYYVPLERMPVNTGYSNLKRYSD